MMISACSEQAHSNKDGSEQPPAQSDANNQIIAQPLLSLSELLSADDVQKGLASAAKDNNQTEIKQWQLRLLDAAKQVNLAPSELNQISGDQGLAFLTFHGMKTNFKQEFEQVFISFEDPSVVYAKYPAFESLKAQSEALIVKRDNLIAQASAVLQQEGLSKQQADAEARAQWQQAMLEQMSATPEKLN
ncbi:hypothetical protein PN836_002245 [Ningiella sp. W23]|uniref:hypothetical protein n=1 Tax=Ningiella sp. W23 TaxID=3023715 RepID=UPI0037575EA1